MTSVDDILEECLQQVLSGRSTLDDCLAQNPQHADLLRPLLLAALQVDHLERPQASRSGFLAGQQRMMDALARKEEKRALWPSRKRGFWRGWSPFGHAGSREGVPTTRLAAVTVLGAATLLICVAAAGLLLRLWNGTLLPQTCIVADASGIAQVQSGQGAVWQTLVAGWELQPGDRIRTGDPARATLGFSGGGSTSIGPNSELEIVRLAVRRDGRGQVIVLRQAAGSTHSLVERLADSTTLFEIVTAGASVVAHGTDFRVFVSADSSTSVVVLEGAVSVTGRETTVMLTGGQAVVVDMGEDPGPVVPAPPEDLVESPSPESSPAGCCEATSSPEMPSGTAILGPASPAPEWQTSTAIATSRLASPTAMPGPPILTTTSGPASLTALPGAATPTTTPKPASPTAMPAAPTSTTTPRSPGPTATLKPPTPTATPRQPGPTETPEPPTPTATPTATATPEPPSPTPTTAPSPTPEPIEIVEVFQAIYKENKEELRVKARTNIGGCSLTLEDFGPMEAEGEHWVYVAESLQPDDVPPTVTVSSSCGGSGSSAVEMK